MIDMEKVINDLQDAVNDDWMWQHADYYAKAMKNAIALLKEQESTLDLHIDSSGIHMSSTGDASQGEQRGLLLGKAMMHEYIEKELLYKGLLTDEIRQLLDSVKRELI